MKIDQSVIGYLRKYFLPRSGDSTVGGSILPDTTDAYSLGRSNKRFDVIYARSVIADNIGISVGGGGGGDADTVDGFHASASPAAGVLLALNASSIYPTSVYPDALLIDGSRTLTGNLSVASGITIDGVDIGAHAASSTIHHLSGMSADDHTQYAHADGVGTRLAYGAERLNRTLTAGNGLTGGGLLTADRSLAILLPTPSGLSVSASGLVLADTVAGNGLTISSKVLAVGAGDGVTVGADTVGLTTPGTLSVSSTNVSAGNHTHAVTASSDVIAGTTSLLQSSSGNLYLAGLGVGVNTLSAVAHIYGVAPQLRLDLGGGFYSDFSVEASGTLLVQAIDNIRLVPAGSVILDPTGNDVRPENNYDLNLGLINKKWLTLHAAELWVETLVAQDTMATIGGRILVGQTTMLEADLTSIATDIVVKHNSIGIGDTLVLEADGKIEFMVVTAGPTGTGPYTYTVTRDLDSTGANDWYAGDAVFNTGQTGDGFIDLYSLQGLHPGSTAGPTIVGNVRLSSAYNDWKEHWALGNLKGLYDYGTDTYGFAAGKYADGATWVSVDATNGFRILNRASSVNTVLGQWSASGTLTIGSTATEHIQITGTRLSFKDGSVERMYAEGSKIVVGQESGTLGWIEISDTYGIRFHTPDTGDGTVRGRIYPSGQFWFGRAFDKERLEWTTGAGLKIYNNANASVIELPSSGDAKIVGTLVVSGTGSIVAGDSSVFLDPQGLRLYYSVAGDDPSTRSVYWVSSATPTVRFTSLYSYQASSIHYFRMKSLSPNSTSEAIIQMEATNESALTASLIAIRSGKTGTAPVIYMESDSVFIQAPLGVTNDSNFYGDLTVDFNLDVVAGDATVGGSVYVGATSGSLYIGGDTRLYRNAADVLRTPDSFIVDGRLTAQSYRTLKATVGSFDPGTGYGTFYAALSGLPYFRNDTSQDIPAMANRVDFAPRQFSPWINCALWTSSNREFMQVPKPAASPNEFEFFDTFFTLGEGWAGRDLTVEIYWTTNTTETTKNIYAQVELYRLRHGQSYSTTATQVTGFSTMDTPANALYIRRHTFTLTLSTATWSNTDAVKLRVVRQNHASDTYSYSMMVAGISVAVY